MNTHQPQQKKSRLRKAIRNQRGQALVEAGLVVSFLVLTSLGLVEFGRAFMISNVLTHALRDGARQAAVVPASQRDSNGFITDSTAIKTRVKDIMKQVLDTSTVNGINVAVSQQAENGINTVKVTATGNIPYTFKVVANSFPINRSVSFRDEGR